MSRRLLPVLLLLLPSLLRAQVDSVPPGMTRYVNTREGTHPTLQDQFLPFRFDYPEEWTISTSMENPGNFVQVNPRRSLMALVTSGDIFSVGPMKLQEIGTHEENLALARDLVGLLEQQAGASFLRYRHDTMGVTTIDGMEGYEVRFIAQPKSLGNIPAGTVLGRFVVVPTESDHGGFVLMMLTDSGSAGVHRTLDVGERGTLGAVLRSFHVTREPQQSKPRERVVPLPAAGDTGTVHYRQTEELTPDGLIASFVRFEFDYPARWRMTPGKMLGNTFVQVNRTMEVGGEEDFSVEALSVGSITFTAPNDSVRRALLQQLAETVESQFSRSFVDYRRSSAGRVTVGGVEGYEIRGSGGQANRGDLTHYLRFIVLPPGEHRGGLILGLLSCSLIDGIRGPEDVGERGELGDILRSFRVLER